MTEASLLGAGVSNKDFRYTGIGLYMPIDVGTPPEVTLSTGNIQWKAIVVADSAHIENL